MKVVVDTSKQYAPKVPEGEHLAIITKVVFNTRDSDASFNAGLNQVTWHFRWDDPGLDPAINASYLREDTCVEDHKSATFVRFMKGIGMDASGFEVDDDTFEVEGIKDVPVSAIVRYSMGSKRNEEGERPTFPHVINVSLSE